MQLMVSWINATRVGQEKQRVEQAYEDRLLSLYNSASDAFNSKVDWKRHNEPPLHPWQLYNIQSHVEACKNLLPSEKHLAHFVIKFMDD
jgi:hypothetical protein